jgi:hypothetical protein
LNRQDFMTLSDLRFREAECLVAAGMLDGAYYLMGYALECALKAAIAKMTKEHDFPPDRKYSERVYVHDLEKLLSAAELDQDLQNEGERMTRLWGVARDWSEHSRYEVGRTASQMQDFHAAASAVLAWVRVRW